MTKIDFSDSVEPVAENILTLVDDGSYTNEELIGGLARAIATLADEYDDGYRVLGQVMQFFEEQ